MNRLYRISALALAAALCLALAACGPKLPGTNSGRSSAGEARLPCPRLPPPARVPFRVPRPFRPAGPGTR